jgi:hypothetical protein
MNLDLARERLGHDPAPALIEGNAGLVAAGFDAQYSHSAFTLPYERG